MYSSDHTCVFSVATLPCHADPLALIDCEESIVVVCSASTTNNQPKFTQHFPLLLLQCLVCLPVCSENLLLALYTRTCQLLTNIQSQT
eukprot:m.144012 g.144012  ORF g.144012 m.144012 type:complete len:88 (+) comp14109_c0_seq8:2272-2535(+)